MPYFLSPQAEYKANRLTQLLLPATLSARPDGKVLVSYNGHIHLFDLENDRLSLMDSVDIIQNPQPKIYEIA